MHYYKHIDRMRCLNETFYALFSERITAILGENDLVTDSFPTIQMIKTFVLFSNDLL